MPSTSGRAGYIALRAPQQTCTHCNHSLGDQDRMESHSSLSKTTNWKHTMPSYCYTQPLHASTQKFEGQETVHCTDLALRKSMARLQGFLLSTFSIDTHLVSLTGSDATETSRHFSAFVVNMVVFRHTSVATLWSLLKDSSLAWTTSLEPATHSWLTRNPPA